MGGPVSQVRDQSRDFENILKERSLHERGTPDTRNYSRDRPENGRIRCKGLAVWDLDWTLIDEMYSVGRPG